MLISEPYLGDEPFVMYLGDNLLNKGIRRFVERVRSRSSPRAQILLAHVPDPQMFGVAELRDGRVVTAGREADASRRATSRSSACTCSARRSSRRSAASGPAGGDELEITDAIQDLIDRGLEVRPHVVDGWWKDTGKLEDMLEANRLILETLERRIDGAVDAESRIEGKVVIERRRGGRAVGRAGPGDHRRRRARIVHAYVGPFTSIMNDVRVRDAEIEHSIVLEGCEISDLANRVEDSLIGKNVRIYRVPVKPSAYRFMLGDNSEVGIRW